MTKKQPPEEEVTTLVEADEDARIKARERARKCSDEIHAVLEKHRCRILPRIEHDSIEPVGLAGDKVQITATFGIFPLSD